MSYNNLSAYQLSSLDQRVWLKCYKLEKQLVEVAKSFKLDNT